MGTSCVYTLRKGEIWLFVLDVEFRIVGRLDESGDEFSPPLANVASWVEVPSAAGTARQALRRCVSAARRIRTVAPAQVRYYTVLPIQSTASARDLATTTLFGSVALAAALLVAAPLRQRAKLKL